jgi:hypothetical protein
VTRRRNLVVEIAQIIVALILADLYTVIEAVDTNARTIDFFCGWDAVANLECCRPMAPIPEAIAK